MNPTPNTTQVRHRLGRFGVWIAPMTLLRTPVTLQREQFARVERLGYGSLWTGEPPASSPVGGREIFAQLAVVLAATERLVAGAGIANITMRDPVATHGGAATLAEAYPGRLVLGLGGQAGARPLSMLRAYLEAMDRAAARDDLPGVGYPRVLAALGPRTHELAGERADGAHPFMQPVEHTGVARRALGPAALLVPHQALVLDPGAARARGRLRALLSRGADGDNPYTANYRRLGYGDADLTGGHSDRLVDAILAWGDDEAVAARLRAHLAAGADHVLLHPLADDLPAAVDQLERLAPRLTAADAG